jgi:hypothetical protein
VTRSLAAKPEMSFTDTNVGTPAAAGAVTVRTTELKPIDDDGGRSA